MISHCFCFSPCVCADRVYWAHSRHGFGSGTARAFWSTTVQCWSSAVPQRITLSNLRHHGLCQQPYLWTHLSGTPLPCCKWFQCQASQAPAGHELFPAAGGHTAQGHLSGGAHQQPASSACQEQTHYPFDCRQWQLWIHEWWGGGWLEW